MKYKNTKKIMPRHKIVRKIKTKINPKSLKQLERIKTTIHKRMDDSNDFQFSSEMKSKTAQKHLSSENKNN